MAREMEGVRRVEIVNDDKFPNASFLGQQGEVLVTIPPNCPNPYWLTVKLENGPIINFLPQEVKTVDPL